MSTMIKKWNDDLRKWYPVGSIAVLPSDIICFADMDMNIIKMDGDFDTVFTVVGVDLHPTCIHIYPVSQALIILKTLMQHEHPISLSTLFEKGIIGESRLDNPMDVLQQAKELCVSTDRETKRVERWLNRFYSNYQNFYK